MISVVDKVAWMIQAVIYQANLENVVTKLGRYRLEQVILTL